MSSPPQHGPKANRRDPIAEVHFEGDRRSASTARAFVFDTLDEIGWSSRGDDAALLVSELVANVILHARTDFTVSVRPARGRLRVEVSDGSAARPQRRHFGAEATTGRGLRLVTEMSAAWGVDPRADGKCVWFELESAARSGPRTARRGRHRGRRPGRRPRSRRSCRARGQGPGPRHRGRSSLRSDGSVRLVDARLLGLPLDVHLEASQHSEEMMREFAHLSDGVSDANPPARLITLNRELERRYASFTQATRTELDEATAAGKGTIDLTFRVPEDVGASIVELGDLLEEVDSYCEAGEYLPTLKTPPRSLAYRQWFLGQFLDQLAGNAPVGWSEWVLRRDTSPSPASTGGAD